MFGLRLYARINPNYYQGGPLFGNTSILVLATISLALIYLGCRWLGLTGHAVKTPVDANEGLSNDGCLGFKL